MNIGKSWMLLTLFGSIILITSLYFLNHRSSEGPSDPTGSSKSLVIYCAAGIQAPVKAALKEFESKYGIKINLEYGGSGTLLSRIAIAPQGDLYLPGDASYIDIAIEKGLVEENIPLAYQTPVIAVQKGNPKKIFSLKDLARSDLKISLGNPESASIGKLGKKCLLKAGLWDAVEENVRNHGVFKPTVPELLTDMELGVSDAALLWDGMLSSSSKCDMVKSPELDAMKQNITIGVLKASKNPTLALRCARYLNSVEGNRHFQANGYETVHGDAWAWEPEITFFCGSVNRRPLKDVLKRFQEREGVVINTKYNGCGILTADMKIIKAGSSDKNFPDVYMACDRYYLNNVKDWFQEDRDISDTDIVIVVPKGNPGHIQSLEDLGRSGVKISMGQPDQCTIGALSCSLLKSEGMYEKVLPNIAVQTASSSMLIPTVMKTENMKTVLDATLAYRSDTVNLTDQIDIVPISSKYAKAIQPFSIATSSTYKFLGRRLEAEILKSRQDFETAGFNFRKVE